MLITNPGIPAQLFDQWVEANGAFEQQHNLRVEAPALHVGFVEQRGVEFGGQPECETNLVIHGSDSLRNFAVGVDSADHLGLGSAVGAVLADALAHHVVGGEVDGASGLFADGAMEGVGFEHLAGLRASHLGSPARFTRRARGGGLSGSPEFEGELRHALSFRVAAAQLAFVATGHFSVESGALASGEDGHVRLRHKTAKIVFLAGWSVVCRAVVKHFWGLLVPDELTLPRHYNGVNTVSQTLPLAVAA